MKKLSKKDRIILAVAGVALAIALCCQGWYYWPWFGGRVVRIHNYWNHFEEISVSSDDIPFITNHSPYSKHQVIKYFHDIALRMEDQPLVRTVRKWETPLCVYIIGTPDTEDRIVLNEIFKFLNDIPGFPGINEVNSLEDANVQLRFVDEHMPKGATGFFNILSIDEKGNLAGIDIWIRNELTRYKKTSVLWEELLQATGPMNDSLLTADTLFYKGTEDILRASELDHTLLEMLYHPLVYSGMDFLQCFSVFLLYLR